MGNICRSPTAEGVMRKLVQASGLADKIFIDSAGTSSYHSGDAPDQRSTFCALDHGVDLRDLRSRPLSAEDFANFDFIFVMDEQNLHEVEARRPFGDARYDKAKVQKILEYAPDFGKNVPDPYYNDGFEKVFEMIEAACKNILEKIR